MSSYQYLEDSIANQVCNYSSCSSNTTRRHGFSKSQMYLQKILRIIASYPSQETSRKSSLNPQILDYEDNKAGGGGGGLGIDLNMGLRSSPEIQEDQSECLTACCSVVNSEAEDCGVFTTEKSSLERECDPLPIIEAIGEKVSGTIINLETLNDKEQELVKTSPDFQEQELKSNKNDCFSLLIEAAETVSGYNNNLKNKEEKEKPPNQEKESEANSSGCDGGGGLSSMKRNDKCGVVDISPVVRSKRGRSQVLPSRYRDSVLIAPWKRLPLPPSLPKRPAAAHTVSNKRGKLNSNNNNKQVKK